MNAEIAKVIDIKAEQMASMAKRRRTFAAVIGGGLAGLVTMIALIFFQAEATTAFWLIPCTVLFLGLCPVIFTWFGTIHVQKLIKQNRMIEARKLSQSLMSTSLKLYPFSSLYFVAGAQLDLMMRDAAYIEVDALSQFLGKAIAAYPYRTFVKKRLLPAFENYRGLASLGLGEYEDARKQFTDCLSTAKGLNKAIFLNNIGVCDIHLGRYDEAYAKLKEAIDAAPPAVRDKLVLPRIYPSLALVCVKLSKFDEARGLLDQSAKYVNLKGQDYSIRAGYYKSLGLLKAAEGHADEGEQHLRTALELVHQLDELHPYVQSILLELATVLDQLGKSAEAEKMRKKVSENQLKFQLRSENTSDELLAALQSGSHPIALLARYKA